MTTSIPAATERLLDRLANEFAMTIQADRPSIETVDPSEPLAGVEAAARARGFTVDLRRLSIADATWLADTRVPFVAWSGATDSWLVITRDGLLGPRVWSTGDEGEEPRRLGRRALASLLGVDSVDRAVDFALLGPARPADDASDRGHGDNAEGEHPGPARRLFELFRPERADLWTILIFSAVTGLLYLALPLAVNAFISNLSFGTHSGPFLQGLIALGTVLFICLAVSAAVRGLQHVVVEVVQRRLFVRLGLDLAHRLPHLSPEANDRTHVPELVNRFLDVPTVQKSSATLLLAGVNLALSTLIGLTVLAFYHPFLLAFSIMLVLALGLIVLLAGRRAVATSIIASKRKYQVVEWLEELARHPVVFKGPGGLDLATGRAEALVHGYLEARRTHFRILMRQVSSLLALEVIAATLLLLLGGWLVLDQQLTLGQLVASEIIVSGIVASISKLGKQFEAWYDAVAAMDKIGHLLDVPLERTDGETATATEAGVRLRVRDLAHARYEGHLAFRGLDLDVAPGDRVALLGDRGIGASSALEILIGLRRAADGSVEIDGLDLDSWDLAALRAETCLLRRTDFVGGTLADNVRLGRTDVSLAAVQRAIDAVGLGATVRGLSDGLSTRLITGGLPLSSRQRSRLAVARAIALQPRPVLVDELLDGLDEETASELSGILRGPELSSTVILATRRRDLANEFDRVVPLPPEGGRG